MEWNGMASPFECFPVKWRTGRRKSVCVCNDEWQTSILRDFDLKKQLLTLHLHTDINDTCKKVKTKKAPLFRIPKNL